ncbi:MAG: hypothetical protein AAGD32_11990 [Planctomycetota bacterium]
MKRLLVINWIFAFAATLLLSAVAQSKWYDDSILLFVAVMVFAGPVAIGSVIAGYLTLAVIGDLGVTSIMGLLTIVPMVIALVSTAALFVIWFVV